MLPGVKEVKPLSEYKLLLTFDNGEIRIFDVKPYLETGIYKELKDEKTFSRVKVSFDSIEWDNGVDLCPEVLYQNSIVQN